jgi:ectoine hydroxylase-related dioxygenase (phytanoyl-CoA dioxygenase family)
VTHTTAAAEIDAYRRDGAVVLRGLLTDREVELARSGIDGVLASPGPLALTASTADDPGSFVEDFRRWHDIAEIEQVARSARIVAAARTLMGSAEVRLFHDHVLAKEPGTRQRTPWHQDQPYYNVDGDQTISFWIPVDPVPEGAGLELVAGTHRGPWLMPRTFMDGEARWFPEGSLEELPDIEADRAAWPIRTWALEPGDAIAFHGLTVHGAPGFAGPGRRRVLSLRYLGDDARHAPRTWRTSPPFPGLENELPAGAPMVHDLFPLLS